MRVPVANADVPGHRDGVPRKVAVDHREVAGRRRSRVLGAQHLRVVRENLEAERRPLARQAAVRRGGLAAARVARRRVQDVAPAVHRRFALVNRARAHGPQPVLAAHVFEVDLARHNAQHAVGPLQGPVLRVPPRRVVHHIRGVHQVREADPEQILGRLVANPACCAQLKRHEARACLVDKLVPEHRLALVPRWVCVGRALLRGGESRRRVVRIVRVLVGMAVGVVVDILPVLQVRYTHVVLDGLSASERGYMMQSA
jgi:hypothetical protein